MGQLSDMAGVSETTAQAMPDLTLDEMAALLAPRIAEMAAFDGWSDTALQAAASAEQIDIAVARLAFPHGAMDMIAAWIGTIDHAMGREFSVEGLQELSIRERIRTLVQFRLNALIGLEEAVRRALAIMAMPQNARRAARLSWAGADRMWRLAGDGSTDISYYTRRTTLAAVYGASLLAFIDDESEGKAETRAFLDRRIAGVIRFEKAKARIMGQAGGQPHGASGGHSERVRFSMARFLGRLRYPAH